MSNEIFILINFLLTFIIELIIYFIFIRDKKLNIVLYCLLINLFTWPLANLIYGFWANFWLIELCVFLIEFILIKILFNISWKRAITISLIANLISASLSQII